MGREEWFTEARLLGWFLTYAGSCYLRVLYKDCPRAVTFTRPVVFNLMLDMALVRPLKTLLIQIP